MCPMQDLIANLDNIVLEQRALIAERRKTMINNSVTEGSLYIYSFFSVYISINY